MHQVLDQKAAVEFPQKGETITSSQYTVRIAAPTDARRVEVSIDGYPFSPARLSADRWWFDWANYGSGYHTVAVRVTLRDGYVFTLPPVETQVELEQNGRGRHGRGGAVQFSVTIPNEPGGFAKLTQLLSREGVDLQGVATERIGDSATVRLVTAREDGLRRTLENAGFPVLESEVFRVELQNRPAELNRLARTLAEEGVRIVSLYSTAHEGKATAVVAVDRPETAVRAITRNGFDVVESSN